VGAKNELKAELAIELTAKIFYFFYFFLDKRAKLCYPLFDSLNIRNIEDI